MTKFEMAAEPKAKALHVPVEFKELDEEERTFTGLASTWERDLQDDVIVKGAFRKTLAEWRKSGSSLPLLDSHNYYSGIRAALGKLIEAKEKDVGLWTKWQVVPDNDGDSALARIKDGIIDSMSIGYRPIKWETEEDDSAEWGFVRYLKEIELREVSLVLWPANPGARLDPVKAAIDKAEMPAEYKRAMLESLGYDVEQEPPPPPTYSAEKVRAFKASRLAFRIRDLNRRLNRG